MSRRYKAPEQVSGGFSQLPHAVLRSASYIGCTPLARALLVELIDQHNGKNNGHLHLSAAYLAGRGFRSKAMIDKGRKELIERNLIVLTKQGGLPTRKAGVMKFEGASLYALTWLHISNYVGLEVSPKSYHPGAWHMPVQIPKLKQPERLASAQKKRLQPTVRDRTGPQHGKENVLSAPHSGSAKPFFRGLSDPQGGQNVFNHYTPVTVGRVVRGIHRWRFVYIGGTGDLFENRGPKRSMTCTFDGRSNRTTRPGTLAELIQAGVE